MHTTPNTLINAAALERIGELIRATRPVSVAVDDLILPVYYDEDEYGERFAWIAAELPDGWFGELEEDTFACLSGFRLYLDSRDV